MKSFLQFFIKDGRSTTLGGWVVIALSAAVIFGVVHYRVNNFFGWFLLFLSCTLIAIFGVAGRAEALGLKPFTNDPLGWRKAKESYKADAASNDVSKKDDPP